LLFVGKTMTFRSEGTIGYWLSYAQRCIFYAFSEVLKVACLEHQKTYSVTPSQWGMLSLLYDENGLTIGTISQRRGADAPTVTGIVKRLEQSGLVERLHDREDRRVVKVYLTAEGRDAMSFLPEAVRAYDEILIRGFTEVEQRDLLTKLQQIILNMSAVGPDTGDRFGLLPSQFVSDLTTNSPAILSKAKRNTEKEENI
jgi:DNA-binding MarR family transcriptional regulator